MNRRSLCILVAALALTCVLVLVPVSAYAKSFSVSEAKIDAVINADGSMHVQEVRSFDYRGHFTGAEEFIPLVGSSDSPSRIQASDVRFLEVGGPRYRQVHWFEDYKHTSASPPATFMVEPTRTELHVVWFYDATDTRRTFRLNYLLKWPAARFKDVGELYWKFIGPGWLVETRDISLRIYLPPGATPDNVMAWAHGPSSPKIQMLEESAPGVPNRIHVLVTADKVGPGQELEARVVFPQTLLRSSGKRSKPVLAQILAEEGLGVGALPAPLVSAAPREASATAAQPSSSPAPARKSAPEQAPKSSIVIAIVLAVLGAAILIAGSILYVGLRMRRR